jgi:hypothetical protein
MNLHEEMAAAAHRERAGGLWGADQPAAVDANAELFRKYGGFADPVPVPESAPAFDRLLAASGRDPGWAPTGR